MNHCEVSSYIVNQVTTAEMNSIDCINNSKSNVYSSLDFDLKNTNSDIDLLDEIELSKTKKTTTSPQINRRVDNPDKYKLLGEWVGIVEEIHDQYFVANVRDSLNPHHSRELAEFNNDDILNSELKHLATGAIFYWTIGYKTTNNTKYKVSNINFRKSLPISNSLKEKAQEQSNKLISFFSQF